MGSQGGLNLVGNLKSTVVRKKAMARPEGPTYRLSPDLRGRTDMRPKLRQGSLTEAEKHLPVLTRPREIMARVEEPNSMTSL
jgi:hypothetical protein